MKSKDVITGRLASLLDDDTIKVESRVALGPLFPALDGTDIEAVILERTKTRILCSLVMLGTVIDTVVIEQLKTTVSVHLGV